jgi:hypothetical protein
VHATLSPSFSLSLSLTGEHGTHTLFTGQIERERERGRKREAEREREREKERKREWERETCPELLFLFLKGMKGALAPFSYQVLEEAGSACQGKTL